MVQILAEEEPLWPPGEGHRYHALTFGWLAGEVVRRITGMGVQEFFVQRVVRPLKVDAWIGVPEEELPRIAQLYQAPLPPDASQPVVEPEAAALAESLLDRELFGDADKPGLFETANGGTVLVDEVSELPLGTQAKLLRVLERGEVIRVDTVEPRKVDVRFIAATNRDLRAMVSEGTFREDLYFRLNGITIEVPPLRERREQIAQIASELLTKACTEARRAPLPLTKRARCSTS